MAVEDARANAGVVFAHEFSGALVERDQAGGIGGRDVDVRPVLAVGGAGINQIAHNEERTIGGVVRKDAQFIHHVVFPYNVGVVRADFGGGIARAGDVLGFVHERPLVAFGHAPGAQAHDFTTAGDDIDAVAFDVWGREQAEIFPIVDFARRQFGNDQLPEKSAGLFIETHQDAAVALVLRIARVLVVGADKNFPAGDDDVAVALRADFDGPFDVGNIIHINLLRARLEIDVAIGAGGEMIRQISFRGGVHVAARIRPAPARPIGGGRRETGRNKRHGNYTGKIYAVRFHK